MGTGFPIKEAILGTRDAQNTKELKIDLQLKFPEISTASLTWTSLPLKYCRVLDNASRQ